PCRALSRYTEGLACLIPDRMTQPLVVDINPIAFHLGPVQVHWYGLMYLVGFFSAAALGEYRRRKGRLPVTRDALGDLFFYGMMGVIAGGLLGVLVAGLWLSRKAQLHFLHTVDFVGPLVPIGLGLGRLGNFINGE